jgi:multidrug efflux system outer membrane protein
VIPLLFATAQAATLELSLAAALDLVEERNPDLRSASLATTIAHIGVERARLDRFSAQVTGNAFAELGFVKPWGEPFSDTQSASWDTRASGGVVLYSGGRVNGGIAQAAANEVSTQDQATLTLRDLQRATYTAYWNVKGIELSIGATEDGLGASREALEIIEAKARAGLAAELDVNRSRVGVVSQEADLVSQRQRLFSAELDLCRLLQLDDTDLVLTDELPTEFDLSPVSLPADPASARPELHQLEATLRGNDADVVVARSAALPTVSLQADVGATGAAAGGGVPVFGVTPTFDGDGLRPTLDGAVGLVATWNPFDLFRARMNVDRATLAGQQIEARTESQRLALETEIRVAGQQVDTLRTQVPLIEEQVSLARSNLQIVQDLYSQGNATILDLFNAQDQFRSARLREADLLVRLRLAEVDLSWSLARDLQETP